jgi:hypothetical protein
MRSTEARRMAPGDAWSKLQRSAPGDAPRALDGASGAQPAAPTDEKIDQQKFAAVYRAATALARANDAAQVTRSGLDAQLDRFADEVAAATARAHSASEMQLVGFYADALAAYRDGLQFWALSRFADRPGQSAALDALAAKYGIQPGSKISYTAAWQSYPNAFGRIWAAGDAAAAKGSLLYSRQQ